MYGKYRTLFLRILSFVLIIALMAPISAVATVQPRASLYLDNYNAYVYLPGDGEVRVYFNAEGTDDMDELGALTIEIWESTDNIDWYWVESFTHDGTSGMLSYNDDYHSGYVSYDGVAGRYYKAYVCIWGGKDGDGDTRYFWTSVKH